MKDTTTTAKIEAARKIQAEIRLLTAPTECPIQRRKFNKLFKSRDALKPASMLYGTWASLVCSK